MMILSKLFNNKRILPKHALQTQKILLATFKKLHTNKGCLPVKEVQIPTQWGHISGKLWGAENRRPILALHGWQDNAGTWDTLAPMLACGRPILAIDFPGHGLSTWYPRGMQYFCWMWPSLILHIKEHFKWDKLSLLCHSMGSIAGLRFASVFPSEVDCFIGIDSLIFDDQYFNVVLHRYPILIKKLLKTQTLLDTEPPSYSIEEMTKIWHLGTSKSVDMSSVTHLLKRGSKPSSKDPNKYYFSRDPRLKHILFNFEDKKFIEGLVKGLMCPSLYLKATGSSYATDDFAIHIRNVITKNNPKFETHFVPGTHHVHLNNPEVVAPILCEFLKKHNLFC